MAPSHRLYSDFTTQIGTCPSLFQGLLCDLNRQQQLTLIYETASAMFFSLSSLTIIWHRAIVACNSPKAMVGWPLLWHVCVYPSVPLFLFVPRTSHLVGGNHCAKTFGTVSPLLLVQCSQCSTCCCMSTASSKQSRANKEHLLKYAQVI